MISRFSEDIDIRLEPRDGSEIETKEERKQFFNKLPSKLAMKDDVTIERTYQRGEKDEEYGRA